jgi:hypothetical protein
MSLEDIAWWLRTIEIELHHEKPDTPKEESLARSLLKNRVLENVVVMSMSLSGPQYPVVSLSILKLFVTKFKVLVQKKRMFVQSFFWDQIEKTINGSLMHRFQALEFLSKYLQEIRCVLNQD